jgi:hypothetical protein
MVPLLWRPGGGRTSFRDHGNTTSSMNANYETPSSSSIPQTPAQPRRQHGNPAAIRRNKIVVVLLFAAMLVFVVVNVWLAVRRPTLPDEVDGVVQYNDLTSDVVSGPIDYEVRPPAGGPHAELPQLCGLYRVQVADENLVASLATGAVWIAYQPTLSDADVETLRETAQGELDVVLTPYEGLPVPVVVTAWERQLLLDDPADERIAMAIAIYRDHERAPLVDENCARGVGLPAP